MAKNVDWIAIKNEYINTNISYRKLADKYHISFSTLEKTARKEEWSKQRKEQCDKIETKVRQKTADKIAEKKADALSRVATAAEALLGKIEEATEQLDRHLVKNKKKTRTIEYKNEMRPDKSTKEIIEETEKTEFVSGDIDRTGLKMVVGALKDLKDVLKDDMGKPANNGILEELKEYLKDEQTTDAE